MIIPQRNTFLTFIEVLCIMNTLLSVIKNDLVSVQNGREIQSFRVQCKYWNTLY